MRSAALAGSVVALGVWMIMLMAGCGGPPAGDRGFWRPWYQEPATVGDSEPTVSGDVSGDPSGPAGANGNANGSASGTGSTDGTASGDGSGAPDGVGGQTGTASACGLAVVVTTASFGGAYAPSNIGAIWIADEHDRFVKSLAVWADRRREHLDRWVAETTAAGLPNNRLDAVSTATKTSHGTRSAHWDCTDAGRAAVADGNYRVCFELTESNGAGPLDCIAFAKGPAAQDITPDDRPTFKKRRVVFTP